MRERQTAVQKAEIKSLSNQMGEVHRVAQVVCVLFLRRHEEKLVTTPEWAH